MTPTMSTWCSNQLSYNPMRSTEKIIAQSFRNCKLFFAVPSFFAGTGPDREGSERIKEGP